MRGRHRYRKQCHRYRRQAKPDHAFDETRQKEHRGNENQESVGHSVTLTDRQDRHNLELVELAFGYDEGRWIKRLPCVFIWSIFSFLSPWRIAAASRMARRAPIWLSHLRALGSRGLRLISA